MAAEDVANQFDAGDSDTSFGDTSDLDTSSDSDVSEMV